MPVTPTYPGVYVEEIPSGVRTITGVATSITAFVGRTLRGPVNQAVTINSFADFERTFGGLWVDSSLGYAVRDFYRNGGSQAVIVRLFHPYFETTEEKDLALAAANAMVKVAKTEAAKSGSTVEKVKTATTAELAKYDDRTAPEKDAASFVHRAIAGLASDAAAALVGSTADSAAAQAVPQTKASLDLGTTANSFILEVANEGAWGNSLRAFIDHNVPGIKESPQTYQSAGLAEGDLFNLTIRDTLTGAAEVFRNLTIKPSPRQIDRVLANESTLVRVKALPSPPTVPAATTDKEGIKPSGQGSNGQPLQDADFAGQESQKTGFYALEQVDLFNLLCLPLAADVSLSTDVVSAAATYCERRRAFLLLDPPPGWTSLDKAKPSDLGTSSKNAAVFFPRLKQANPLRGNQIEEFAPCGAIAGILARTDAQRGVWKAPAGLEATLVGVSQLSVALTDAENGQLNQLGINCLRTMPGVGQVVWGARTLQGNDRLASEWKYIPVRRLALYIQESLYRGTQWVVFEPNDEPLWAQVRLNLGAFMHNLFRQGAFQGKSPREAYFVKCDRETTTQNDINLGIVNIQVGFAPLKPAEFVVIQLQQMAGQIQA